MIGLDTNVLLRFGGAASTTGTPGGGVKRNWTAGMGCIGRFAGEGEAGERAVGLFNLDGGDGSVRCDRER
jgi:hypothetical protein